MPYLLRHSAVSLLIYAGAPIEEVADLLGDDPQAVYRHYGHRVRLVVGYHRGRAYGATARRRGRPSVTAELRDPSRADRARSPSGRVHRPPLPVQNPWSGVVEAMGIEPTNLLHAMQALYQLSYAPKG